MINLDNTTLLCIENRSPKLGLYAINKSTEHINFREVVFITDKKRVDLDTPNIKILDCPNFKSGAEYSTFVLESLHEFFSTDFCLLIQWDGFVLNPNMWSFDFFKYDYIGPSWPHHPLTPVGNGGFSLRSRKLALATASQEFQRYHPEDHAISVGNRTLLEKKFDIKFATKEIADIFGIERETWKPAFGFHGFFNFSRALTSSELINFISSAPPQILGGEDTYDLIELLLEEKNSLAYVLLKKTKPKVSRKYKLQIRHLKLILRYHYLHLKKMIKVVLFNRS